MSGSRRAHRASGPAAGSAAGSRLIRAAIGLAGAVAAMLAVLLVTQTMSPAACASAVHAAAAKAGTATWYTLGGLPNCSFPTQPDYFVALGPAEYDAAGACGSYLDVTGPDGSVRVKVVDQCPECEAGELDLSKAAFAQLADPQRGKVSITYRRVVNPAVPDLSVRVKEGSSQWWLAVLVDHHGNPLTRVQVRSGSGAWASMSRVDYNYWIKEDGAGKGPFQVRVTDDQGHTATVSGVDLAPGATQKSSVSLYRGGATGADPSTTEPRRTTTRATTRPTSTKPTTAATSTTGRTTPPGTTTSPALTSTSAPEGTASAVAATRC